MTLQLQRQHSTHLHLPRLRSNEKIDASPLHAVWEASQVADDSVSRPRDGWWSVTDWATTTRPLVIDGEVIGLAAVYAESGHDLAEARLALFPDKRTRDATRILVAAAVGLARANGAERLRLVVPREASWAGGAAREAGFELIRKAYVMLRPNSASPLGVPRALDVRVRRLHPGEETELLAALNRAWRGAWGFTPIPPSALADDLRDQHDGMLIAVDPEDDARIVATIHAMFDDGGRNVDGGLYAWISNLTTDPDWRGRGLARLMLARGVDHLRERGAGSVMLGVDGGNDAAVGLYRSAGFEIVSTTEILERPLDGETVSR